MRQYLVYIGPIIGLAGVSLAIYFHMQSIQERLPTYYVSPQRAEIVNETGPTPSELQILHHGQPVHARSVGAATVYFWNDGKMPIRRSDILEPLSINLPTGTEILEARILQTSRPVVKFEKGDIAASSRNVLPISFEILERSDGAAIQLIYAGDPDPAVSMSGTIVGVGSLRLMNSKSAERYFKRNPKESYKSEKRAVSTIAALGAICIVLGGVLWILRRQKGRSIFSSATLLISGVLYLGMGVYLLHNLNLAFSPGVPESIWLEK